VKWCRTFTEQFHTPFNILNLIDGERSILVFGYFGYILLVKYSNGDLVDSLNAGEKFRSAAVRLSNNEFIAVTETGRICHITVVDNAIKFEKKYQIYFDDNYSQDGKSIPKVFSEPILVDNCLVVAFCRSTYYSDPPIICYEISSNSLKWVANPGKVEESFGNIRGKMAVYNDHLWFAPAYSDGIYALDMNSGEVVQHIKLGETMFQQWSGLALSNNGQVFLPRNDGFVYQVDLNLKTILHRYNFENHEKAIDNFKSVPDINVNVDTNIDSDLSFKWRELFFSTLFLEEDKFYFGTDEGYLYSVSMV